MSTEEFISVIEPYCDEPEDIKGICVFVKTDEYREKMVKFIQFAERVGDKLDADKLVTLSVILNNEYKAELAKQKAQQANE